MFCLTDTFLEADTSHYSFMLKGLQEVEKELNGKSISFYLLRGQPEQELLYFIQEISAGLLVTDFNPLRTLQKWKNDVLIHAKAPFYEVDAHNIILCWFTSLKQEYGAYTIRPKIKRLLFDFLKNIPPLNKHPYNENSIIVSIWA